MSNIHSANGKRLKQLTILIILLAFVMVVAFLSTEVERPAAYAASEGITLTEECRIGEVFTLPYDTDAYLSWNGTITYMTDDFWAFLFCSLNIEESERSDIAVTELYYNGEADSILPTLGAPAEEITLAEGSYSLHIDAHTLLDGNVVLESSLSFVVAKQTLIIPDSLTYRGDLIEENGSAQFVLTEIMWSSVSFGTATVTADDRSNFIINAYTVEEGPTYSPVTAVKDIGNYKIAVENEITLSNNQVIKVCEEIFEVTPYTINGEGGVQEVDETYFNCTKDREFITGDINAYYIWGNTKVNPSRNTGKTLTIFGDDLNSSVVSVNSGYYYDSDNNQVSAVGDGYHIILSCVVNGNSNYAPFTVEIYDAAITRISVAFSKLGENYGATGYALIQANKTNRSKVYDGTTNMRGSIPSGNYTYNGLTLVGCSAEYEVKDVGTGKTYYLTPVFEGEDVGNYTFLPKTLTDGTITAYSFTAAEISLSMLNIPNKTYDGTNTLTVTNVSLPSSKIFGTGVTENLSFAITASFNNANAGVNKALTVKVNVTPANGNYAETSLSGTSTIEKYDLTVDYPMDTFLSENSIAITTSKVYDNSTSMVNDYVNSSKTLNGVTVGGSPQTVTITGLNTAYKDKNSSDGQNTKGYDVTATLNSANYTFAMSYATGASISDYILNSDPLNPEIEYTDINYTKTKEYDGSKAVFYNGGQLTLNSVTINGESLSFTASGEYGVEDGEWTERTAVGSDLDIKFTLTETNGNYAVLTLYDTESLDLSITKKNLAMSDFIAHFGINKTKTYDKTTAVTYDSAASMTLSVLLNGVSETVTLSSFSMDYDNINAGTNKTYSLVGTITAVSSDLANYNTSINTSLSDGVIERRSLNTVSGLVVSPLEMSDFVNEAQKTKAYDCTPALELGLTNNEKPYSTAYGDDIVLTVRSSYENKNVGTSKWIYIAVSVDPDLYGNYCFIDSDDVVDSYTFSSQDGVITKVGLTYDLTSDDIKAKVMYALNASDQSRAIKTYDGTNKVIFINASFALNLPFDTNNADIVASVSLTGTYAQSDIGTNLDFTVVAEAPLNYLLNGVDESKTYNYSGEGEIKRLGKIEINSLPAGISVESERLYNGTAGVKISYLEGESLGSLSYTSFCTVNNYGMETRLDYDFQVITAINGSFENKHIGTNKTYYIDMTVDNANFEGLRYERSDGRVRQVPIMLIAPERDGDDDHNYGTERDPIFCDYTKPMGESDSRFIDRPYSLTEVGSLDMNDAAIKAEWEARIEEYVFFGDSLGSIQFVDGAWYYMIDDAYAPHTYTYDSDGDGEETDSWVSDRILLSFFDGDIDSVNNKVSLAAEGFTYGYDAENGKALVPFERYDEGEIGFENGNRKIYRLQSPFLAEYTVMTDYYVFPTVKYVYDEKEPVWSGAVEISLVIIEGYLNLEHVSIDANLTKRYDGNDKVMVSGYLVSLPSEVAENKPVEVLITPELYDIRARLEIIYSDRNKGIDKPLYIKAYLEPFVEDISKFRSMFKQAVVDPENPEGLITVDYSDEELEQKRAQHRAIALSYIEDLDLMYSNVSVNADGLYEVILDNDSFPFSILPEALTELDDDVIRAKEDGNVYYREVRDENSTVTAYRFWELTYTRENSDETYKLWTAHVEHKIYVEGELVSLWQVVEPVLSYTTAEMEVFLATKVYHNVANRIVGSTITWTPPLKVVLKPEYSYIDEETGEEFVIQEESYNIPGYYTIEIRNEAMYQYWWYDGASYYEVKNPIIINGNLHRMDSTDGRLMIGAYLSTPLLGIIEKGDISIQISGNQVIPYGDICNYITYKVVVNGDVLIVTPDTTGELGYDLDGNLQGRLSSIPTFYYTLYDSNGTLLSETTDQSTLFPTIRLNSGCYYRISFRSTDPSIDEIAGFSDYDENNFELSLDEETYDLTINKGEMILSLEDESSAFKYFGMSDDYSKLSISGTMPSDNIPLILEFEREEGEVIGTYSFTARENSIVNKNGTDVAVSDLYNITYIYSEVLDENFEPRESTYLTYNILPLAIDFVERNPDEGIVDGKKEMVFPDLYISAYLFEEGGGRIPSYEYTFEFVTELTKKPSTAGESWFVRDGVLIINLRFILDLQVSENNGERADILSIVKVESELTALNYSINSFVVYEEKVVLSVGNIELDLSSGDLSERMRKYFDGEALTFTIGSGLSDDAEIVNTLVLGDSDVALTGTSPYKLVEITIAGKSKTIDGITLPDYYWGEKLLEVVSFKIHYRGNDTEPETITEYRNGESRLISLSISSIYYGYINKQSIALKPPIQTQKEYTNEIIRVDNSAENDFLSAQDLVKVPENTTITYHVVSDGSDAGIRNLVLDVNGENGGAAVFMLDGVDITENYLITYSPGTINIAKRTIKIKMTSSIPTFVYTGDLIRAEVLGSGNSGSGFLYSDALTEGVSFTFVVENKNISTAVGLVENETMRFVAFSSSSAVRNNVMFASGMKPEVEGFEIYNSLENADKSQNYKIDFSGIVVNISQATLIFDIYKNREQYTLELNASGRSSINVSPIFLKDGIFTKYYDGQPLEIQLFQYMLREGFELVSGNHFISQGSYVTPDENVALLSDVEQNKTLNGLKNSLQINDQNGVSVLANYEIKVLTDFGEGDDLPVVKILRKTINIDLTLDSSYRTKANRTFEFANTNVSIPIATGMIKGLVGDEVVTEGRILTTTAASAYNYISETSIELLDKSTHIQDFRISKRNSQNQSVDSTNNYIVVNNNVLYIAPKRITVTVAKKDSFTHELIPIPFVYNGSKQIVRTNLFSVEGLLIGHTLSKGELCTVGAEAGFQNLEIATPLEISSSVITANYCLSNDGVLYYANRATGKEFPIESIVNVGAIIDKKEISIKVSDSLRKNYDGEVYSYSLSNSNVAGGIGNIISGQYLSGYLFSEHSDYFGNGLIDMLFGTGENAPKVTSADGMTDYTANYNIVRGEINKAQIWKRDISVDIGAEHYKIYDGNKLKVNLLASMIVPQINPFDGSYNTLQGTDYFDAVSSVESLTAAVSRYEVGSGSSVSMLIIRDEYGEDISANYNITLIRRYFEIRKRPISVYVGINSTDSYYDSVRDLYVSGFESIYESRRFIVDYTHYLLKIDEANNCYSLVENEEIYSGSSSTSTGDANEYSLLTMTAGAPILIRNGEVEGLEDNYEISYLRNSCRIKKRDILIDIGDTANNEKVYDGNPCFVMISNAMVVSGEGYSPLVDGHRVTGTRKTVTANVGSNIEFTTGEPIVIFNDAGEVVTHNYAIEGIQESRIFVHRTARIDKKRITFDIMRGVSGEYQKVYDGTPLSIKLTSDMVVTANMIPPELVSEIGGLVYGHSVRNTQNNSTMISVSSNVGTWPVKSGTPVVIVDGQDNDVSSNYDVVYKGYIVESNAIVGESEERTVKIVKRSLMINPGNASRNTKYYDGEIFTLELSNNHVVRLNDAGIINSFYIEGTASTITASVHSSKELIINTSSLRVYRMEGENKVYSSFILDGDSESGSFTYIDNYEIVPAQGYCSINKRPVYVYGDLDNTVVKTKPFDGEAFELDVTNDMVVEESDRAVLQSNQVDIGSVAYLSLPDGITLQGFVRTESSMANARLLVPDDDTYIKLMMGEDDITSNFSVKVIESYVAITTKEITIRPSLHSLSEEKVYDGEVWSMDISLYPTIVGGLLEGHTLVSGTILTTDKNVGENKATQLSAEGVKILYNNNDYSSNYNVTYDTTDFSVSITKKEVTPIARSGAFIYKAYNGKSEASIMQKHYQFEGICVGDEIIITEYRCNFEKYREGEFGSGELLTVRVYSISNRNYALKFDKTEGGALVTDEGGRNYATFTIQGSIAKKDPTLTITNTQRINNQIAVVYSYDGLAKSLTGRYSLTGLEDVSVTHKVTYFDGEDRAISAPIDVGDYYVEFSTYGATEDTPLDNDYPNWSTRIMLRIEKADAYMSFLFDENSVYSGTALDIAVRVTGKNLSRELSLTNPEWEGGELRNGIVCYDSKNQPISSIIDAGTYTIMASFYEGGNYNSILEQTRTITVAPKPITVEYTEEEFIYNGEERELTFKIDESSFCDRDIGEAAEIVPLVLYSPSAPINAGTYTASLHFENKNYSIANNTCALTIKKKPLKVSVLLNNSTELFISEGDSYNYSIVYNGFVRNENEQVFSKPIYVTELPKKSVTNYRVTPYGGASDNYELIYISATVTISEKILESLTEESGTVQVNGSYSAYAVLSNKKVEVTSQNPEYFEIESKLKTHYSETDIFAKYEVGAAYKLSLTSDNVEITQEGMIVRLLLDEELRGKKSYMVAHVTPTGECEMLVGIQDGDWLVFTTGSMGDFAILTPVEKISTEIMILIYLAPVFIFIMGLLLFTLFRKKY